MGSKDIVQWKESRLTELEERCSTPRNIALERIRTQGEIATHALSLLNDGLKIFQRQFSTFPQLRDIRFADSENISQTETAMLKIEPLFKILNFHLQLARDDAVLYEEIGRAGGHRILSQIIKLDPDEHDCYWTEAEYDDFFSLKDVACEIGSLCRPSFPLQFSPYTRDEVIKRLPLVFPLPLQCHGNDSEEQQQVENINILINQVQDRQSAQDDVGFGKLIKNALLIFLNTNPQTPSILFYH